LRPKREKLKGQKVKRLKVNRRRVCSCTRPPTLVCGAGCEAFAQPIGFRLWFTAHRSWLIAFCLLVPANSFPLALAQTLETKLEFRLTNALFINVIQPPAAFWGLGAHLEARYGLEPSFTLNLVLDPGVSFARQVTTDLGLTELYGLYRQGEFDMSVGLERLPLETARLSLPLSLEPLSSFGNRQGRWGVRASWNPEGARVRLALLEDSGMVLPVLSLRREFGGFELEAHTLYRGEKVFVGLGGSGTLAELVFYGEVWGLGYPVDWRYAFGVSGAIGEGVWTLEGGRTAPSALEPVRPLLAGQLTLPQGEEGSWSVISKLFFDPDVFRTQVGLGYIWAREEVQLESALVAQIGSEPLALRLVINLRFYPSLPVAP
jgi:hypothetical protein